MPIKPIRKIRKRRTAAPTADVALAERQPRVVLVRHGQPDIERARWIGHRAFQNYIDRYQQSGLSPESAPPAELPVLIKDAKRIFASDLQRAIESARRLAPGTRLITDQLFTEAPLASPPIRGLRLKVPAWAVVARVAWHGGYTPDIESYRQAKLRVAKAFRILTDAAREDGIAVLVGHGYFNAMVGRYLRLRGWRRVQGAHRAEFWNTVVYEWGGAEPRRKRVISVSRRGRGRSSSGTAGRPI